MAHLLCHLEFLTMNINLTNLISPFSARAVRNVSFLMGPIQEIQMLRTGGRLVQVSKSPVSRWMLFSVQGDLWPCEGGESF